MLQPGYYDVGSPGSGSASGADSCNATPFSVKDILNLVDQGEPYLGCHMEKWVRILDTFLYEGITPSLDDAFRILLSRFWMKSGQGNICEPHWFQTYVLQQNRFAENTFCAAPCPAEIDEAEILWIC